MSGHKTMCVKVEEYVAHRRSFGYDLRITARELRRFAEYADGIRHRGPLSTELVLRWARLAADHSCIYQARRIEMVRPFARYLSAFEPGTQVPPRGLLGPAHRRTQPHIYTTKEVLQLMDAADGLIPAEGLRPVTYRTMIGLLSSTGLRVCEALKLERSDVDLTQQLLIVRQTKFRKSRLIPLHESVCQALSRYVLVRDGRHPQPRSNRFFLSEQGTALLPSVVHYTFQKLRRSLKNAGIGKPPRLYDLRHTFACQRLLRWYRDGIDVQRAIMRLSTYMGHVRVSDTYWYLSGTPELFAIAARRFEIFSDAAQGGTV